MGLHLTHLLVAIVCLFGVACIAVCIRTLVRLGRLNAQCRQHVFAKQLLQLIFVDLGAALALPLLLILFLLAIYSQHRLAYFVVIFLCMLFLAVSVFTETLIVVGFTSTVANHRGCMKAFLNNSWILAWLVGLIFSAAATSYLYSVGSLIYADDDFVVYVVSLTMSNFVVAASALVFISMRLRQHIMIRWPLFHRIRRNYLLTFIAKNVVLIGSSLLIAKAVVGIYNGLLLQIIAFSTRAIMDSLCYSCDFRCSWWLQSERSQDNILEELLYFLADATWDVEHQENLVNGLQSIPSTNTTPLDSSAASAEMKYSVTPKVTSQRQQCQTRLGELRSRIDEMWTRELRINHTAEMLNVLCHAVEIAEAGDDMASLAGHAQDKLQQVGTWVQDCISIRADARGSNSSLLEGVRDLQKREAEYHDVYIKATIEPMLRQLSEPTQIPLVKAKAKECLGNLEADLKAVGHNKEMTSDQFFNIAHSFPDLLKEESAFAEAALRVARANPESARLQHTALQSMVMRMHVVTELGASSHSEMEIAEMAEDWLGYIVFAMGRHPLSADVQREGAMAMNLCVKFGLQSGKECARMLAQALENHGNNMGVAVQCRAALVAVMKTLPENEVEGLYLETALEVRYTKSASFS